MLTTNKSVQFFQKNSPLLTGSLVALLCLILFSTFPVSGIFQNIIASIFFFFIIPVLYIKLILKKDLISLGLGLGKIKIGVLFGIASFVLSILIFYLLLNYTSFQKNYAVPLLAMHNFWFFILYEIVISGIFIALYEIFFRGFIMLGLSQKFNSLSPLIQFFVLILFFLMTESLIWQNTLIIITAFFSGWTTYTSRSLIYSFLASLAFIITVDAILIKLSATL